MLQLKGHTGTVHALAFTGGGRTLVSGGKDGLVRLWDLGFGEEEIALPGHRGPVLCVAASADSRLLATGGRDGLLLLWSLEQPERCKKLPSQTPSVTGLAWLPGRDTLLAASGERLNAETPGVLSVGFHDGPGPAPYLQRFEDKGLWCLAVSASGPTIAWSGGARTATAWDITRQEPRLFRQSAPSLAIALSPDGKLLATACDRVVKLWDVTRGQERAILEGHQGTVRALAFSPDGRMLATAGFDHLVRFWSIGDRIQESRRFEWPLGAVFAVAFSPDGLLAAAAGQNGKILVWDVDE